MKKGRILVLCGLAMLFVFCFAVPVRAMERLSGLEGDGTRENPYLIQNYEDLCYIRKQVNRGIHFEDRYFRQTANIDMKHREWIPIGIGKNYFQGVYDGAGHFIENLKITKPVKDKNSQAGLFGSLAGTVANLGIESGTICAYSCGAIAVNAYGEHAAILNCYSKAEIKAYRGGGIAEFFSGGTVVCSWSSGKIIAFAGNGIVASGGDVKLSHCFTAYPSAAPSDVESDSLEALTETELFSEQLLRKLNVNVGLSQYMFANRFGVRLMQWERKEGISGFVYSDATGMIRLFGFMNTGLLPVLTGLFMLYAAWRLYQARREMTGRKYGESEKSCLHQTGQGMTGKRYGTAVKHCFLIFGAMSFFLDTAFYAKGTEYLNTGNICFLVQCNLICFACVCLGIRNHKWKFKREYMQKFIRKQMRRSREHLPVLTVTLLVLLLQLLQFDLVPKYDACLYYGSFVKAAQLFRMDFLTYIGSFFCWKWVHGLALFLAPFEFLLPGKMIGIYIGNMLITVLTIYCLYMLLRRMFAEISSVLAAMCCGFFVFCPYGLGLFTYLCMDWHLAFFAVWLIYFVQKKENVLISVCGFLLSFTKITGLVFYVFYLMAAAFLEILSDKKGSLPQRVFAWLNLKKVVLWTAPAAVFMIVYLNGANRLAIQSFYGTYAPDEVISLKSGTALMNTWLQTFVFGFRWLIIAGLYVVVFFYVKDRVNKTAFTAAAFPVFGAVTVSCIGVLALLCVYNGDAECPRYTAIFNVFYTFAALLTAVALFRKEIFKRLCMGVLTVLLVMQTYWSIDPAMRLLAKSIDSGKKQIYRLAAREDRRAAMNLGVDYGPGYEVLGDIFTYNMEHAYYDDLLQKAFETLEPDGTVPFFVLDMIDYEFHISGSYHRNYKIYWNTRFKRRTYDGQDEHSVYLNVGSITTADACAAASGELDMPEHFYLVAAARVDDSAVRQKFAEEGYCQTEEVHPYNLYGRLSVYEFQKRDVRKHSDLKKVRNENENR